MAAVIETGLLYALLAVIFGKLGIKRFLIIAAIVSLPFRCTYELFDNSEAALLSANGISLSASEVCLVVLALIRAGGRAGRASTSCRLGPPILAFIAATAASGLNSTWLRMTAFMTVSLAIGATLYYFVLEKSLVDAEDLEAVWLGFNTSLLLQGAVGCIQFALQQNFLLFSTGYGSAGPLTVGDDESGEFIRVIGTLGRPNGYGMHVALLLLLSLAAGRLRFGWAWLRRGALVFGCLGLLFSFSREAWVGTVAGLVCYGWVLTKRRELSVRKVVLGGVVAVVVLLPFGGLIHTRLTADDHNAAMSRIPLLGIAWNMIKAHPVLGIGANTSRSVMRNYLPADYPQAFVDQVHNMYLAAWSECGIVGLLSLVWLAAKMCTTTYRHAVQSDVPVSRVFGAALLAGETGFLVYNNFDMGNSLANTSALFIMCSLVAVLGRIEPWPRQQESSGSMPCLLRTSRIGA